MTVLTFPSNPTNGQRYAAPNGIQYVFDGVKWIVESSSNTSEAISNSTQDRVAPMFVDGDNTGITFTYDAETNTMSAEVTAVNSNQLVNGQHEFTLGSDGTITLDGDPFNNLVVATSTVLGGVKLGEGFTADVDDKVTTNKLYSTNLTQPNQHYRLTLDTNGVVILPDQSIINGATLKSVAGNYAGITAGPVGRDEDSWMWVDGDGAWIGTTYSTDQKTWHFDNTGKLTLPTNGTISFGTDNGDNWNAPLVNTVQAALEELAARITAVENIEIEGGNAYAIAGPELIIDGNGA